MYRIRRLVSPTDEMIDLDETQRKRALGLTQSKYEEDAAGSRHRTPPSRPSGLHIRSTRNPRNGLLLLYPLLEKDKEGLPFVGFAASFPAADRDTPVVYFVNSVYWQEEMES